jgi:hypothetical protein
MDVIAQRWIADAFRTDPVKPGDVADAMIGLYAAANLKPPRVVVVPSPRVMALAYGAAAAIWHCRTRAATRAATDAATDAATYAATRAATYDTTAAATRAATAAATRAATDAATYAATAAATYDATAAATDAATSAATFAATDAATSAATRAATDAATRAATDAATDAATSAATSAATRAATFAATDAATSAATFAATDAATSAATFALECAKRWYISYQGGNMWAGFCAYAEACRDVLGLHLPMAEPWLRAACAGGFRVLHPEFVMVCDRPEILRIDDRNLPHCADGPSHRWRDGWSLYHWHGTRVPATWITDRANLRAAEIMAERNVEVRRAGIEILGWSRIIDELGGKVIDASDDPEIGAVIEMTLPDLAQPARFLRVKCATGRDFALGLPPDFAATGGYSLPHCAQAWVAGLHPAEWRKPSITA